MRGVQGEKRRGHKDHLGKNFRKKNLAKNQGLGKEALELSLRARMPLRDIVIRGSSGAVHIVDRLPVDFVKNDAIGRELSTDTKAWHQRPFLYVYLMKCEDLDSFKNVVRPHLRSWIDALEEGSEWLVVYLPLERSSSRFEASSKIYRKVFERMKSDFKFGERFAK